MLNSVNLDQEIIDIISSKYDVELSKDEDLELSDDNNLCLLVKNETFDMDMINNLIKGLNVRVNNYGRILVFRLN